MIKIENVMVCGLSWLTGFRRSFNSQAKSDSLCQGSTQILPDAAEGSLIVDTKEKTVLGPSDIKKLSGLTLNGDSHAKVNRFVQVYHTLTLPRRVWVDFDTYRIGRRDGIYPDDIEYMSDSTMHTITRGYIEASDCSGYTDQRVLDVCNEKIKHYNLIVREHSANDHQIEALFLSIKDNLPEGFLQTRNVLLNYQALRHIYFDRKNHKQPEFREYTDWIKSLPAAEQLITVNRSQSGDI